MINTANLILIFLGCVKLAEILIEVGSAVTSFLRSKLKKQTLDYYVGVDIGAPEDGMYYAVCEKQKDGTLKMVLEGSIKNKKEKNNEGRNVSAAEPKK